MRQKERIPVCALAVFCVLFIPELLFAQYDPYVALPGLWRNKNTSATYVMDVGRDKIIYLTNTQTGARASVQPGGKASGLILTWLGPRGESPGGVGWIVMGATGGRAKEIRFPGGFTLHRPELPRGEPPRSGASGLPPCRNSTYDPWGAQGPCEPQPSTGPGQIPAPDTGTPGGRLSPRGPSPVTIAGNWRTSAGSHVRITVRGGWFEAVDVRAGFRGRGQIRGRSLEVQWFDPRGRPAGRLRGEIASPTMIRWQNGLVFIRIQ